MSEENGQISLVQRARIVRNLNEAQLARALRSLLEPARTGRGSGFPAACPARARRAWPTSAGRSEPAAEIGGAVEPLPPDEPLVPG